MAQVTVDIPPLRRRMGDLPVLIEDILEQLGRPDMTVDEAGMSALQARSWPGNIRQLRTIIRAALVESDGNRLMLERALAGIPTDVGPQRASGLYDAAKRELDRRFYAALHTRFGGNLSQIAKSRGQATHYCQGSPARQVADHRGARISESVLVVVGQDRNSRDGIHRIAPRSPRGRRRDESSPPGANRSWRALPTVPK